jgi:hypothetical protein
MGFFQGDPLIHLFGKDAFFLKDRGQGVGVVPRSGCGKLTLDFGEPFPAGTEVKDAPRRRKIFWTAWRCGI